MRYRRDDTKGGTWFFTVNLAERNKTILDICGQSKN